MEAVGLVASVATLIEAANFVRTTLSDYKRGGKDRDRLLAEVDSLKSVLGRLQTDNHNAKQVNKQEPWLDIVGQLSQKGGTVEQIEDVISEVKLKIERKQGLRGAIVHWTWPFIKEDVDRNIRQMQRLSHNVSIVLQDASLKLTLAINEGVTRIDKTTNKRELRSILEWLSPLYFLEQQRLEFLKAFPGTCEWFFRSPGYNIWKQKQHRVLYCSAIGGAGKTILASAAIDDLRMDTAGRDTAVFIMYCKHDRPDTHSVDKLATALLRQLIQLKACQIPPDLEELLDRHYYTNETKPTLEEVLKVINAHLPTFSSVFIVVDGLDEIMQEAARERIIVFLMKLEGAPQVMFTSRPLDLIEKMFLSVVPGEDLGELELTASEDEKDDPYSDDGYEGMDCYEYDTSGESAEEENSSDQGSDGGYQGILPTYDSELSQGIPAVTLNPSSITSENGSQHMDEDGKQCSKCGSKLELLRYLCHRSPRAHSAICISCYDSGTRCVEGDSSHNTYVVAGLQCLKIDVSARPRAIRRYVRSRTQQSTVLMKFVNTKPGFAEEIEDTVTRSAQKMFLLAQLHMDALANPDLLKFSEVRTALDNLPVGLDDSYDNAMSRVQGHGRSLLRLVAYAQRPLNVREVEHALALIPNADEILDDEIIPTGTLISRCAGLVNLDENGEIVFSHYTIVGYFAQRSGDFFGNGHKYMAGISLAYLQLSEFQQGPVHGAEEAHEFEVLIRAFPFYDYASIFWGVHAQFSRDTEVMDISYAFIKNSQCCGASIQALWFSNDEATASWRSRSGGSPLHLAMYFNFQGLANRLLYDGINADIQDAFGMTPLMWAAQSGNVDITTSILQRKAPINVFNNNGQNALHIAIDHSQEEVAILLIDQSGVDVNAPNVGERGSWKLTPLMLATSHEQLKVVSKLLTRADLMVNAEDTHGQTAIHRIAEARNTEVMKALVSAPSIDLGHRDNSGCPVLTLSSMWRNLPAVKALLDAGADVNIRESPLYSQGNALMRAADSDAVYIVQELIDRGIDWTAKDDFGRNAVHSAAINGSHRSLAVLLDLPGIEIDLQDSNGNTPVHDTAGLSFDSPALKLLLSKGAKTDIRNGRGKTPLDTARLKGTRRSVRILREKSAEDFGVPKRSMTSTSLEEPTLPQAAAQGDEAAVASILSAYQDDKSIDLEERDDWLGRTPLQLATDAGHLRIVRNLHQAGANIDVQDNYGRTALHIAALRYRMSIARYLLRKGADMRSRDKWGVSAMEDSSPSLQVLFLQHGLDIAHDMDITHLLFLAAEQGNMKAVQRLVAAGADVQVKDSYGRSPYEQAKWADRAEVAKYLDHVGRLAAESNSHVNTPNTSSDSLKTLQAATVTENDDRNLVDLNDRNSNERHSEHPSDPKLKAATSLEEVQLKPPRSSTQTALPDPFSLDFRNYVIIFLIASMITLYFR